jgi:hypothetical protein
MNKRSKEEVKQIAAKGGVNSGIARKKKKELKERFKLGLEIFTKLKADELKKQGNKEAAEIVKEIGLEVFTFLDILNNDKDNSFLKLQAVNGVLDRIEGKATQKSVIDANINQDKELSPKEIELIKRQIEKQAKKLKSVN